MYKKEKSHFLTAFTVVELMVAVSILSFGMVLVVRSLLSGASALDLAQSRIAAIQILEEKMSEFDELAVKEGGVKTNSGSEDLTLNGKSAVYGFDIKPLPEGAAEEERLNEITLKLRWQENNKQREELLVTYARNREEAQ